VASLGKYCFAMEGIVPTEADWLIETDSEKRQGAG